MNIYMQRKGIYWKCGKLPIFGWPNIELKPTILGLLDTIFIIPHQTNSWCLLEWGLSIWVNILEVSNIFPETLHIAILPVRLWPTLGQFYVNFHPKGVGISTLLKTTFLRYFYGTLLLMLSDTFSSTSTEVYGLIFMWNISFLNIY